MSLQPRSALVAAVSLLLLCGLASPRPRPARQDDAELDKVERISVDELILMVAKKKPVTIIDVRHLDSYEEKIVGALEIPWDQIESRLKEIPRNREIVTYCA
jgi:hypothetical protein